MAGRGLGEFRAVSFDCYGTIVDWETGLWTALGPLVASAAHPPGREAALVAFARAEPEVQAEFPEAPYPEVLARVHRRLAQAWEGADDPALARAFGGSVSSWPPFPDSAGALRELGRHVPLIVLSNVDGKSFAGTAKRLGVAFDAVCTAEEIGSYKPDPANFRFLLERVKRDLGIGRGELLHAAQSVFHDVVPAGEAGIATAWIDRGGGSGGAAGEVADPPSPDFRFPDLETLVRALKEARETP